MTRSRMALMATIAVAGGVFALSAGVQAERSPATKPSGRSATTKPAMSGGSTTKPARTNSGGAATKPARMGGAATQPAKRSM